MAKTEPAPVEEQDLQSILDLSATGIYCMDLDGACTYCNRACLRLLGYREPPDLLGRHFYPSPDVGTPGVNSDGPSFSFLESGVDRTLLDGHDTFSDNRVMWRADGTFFPVEYWARPLWRDGKQTGCVITFVDITRRRLAERAIGEAFESVKLYMAERDAMEVQLRQAQKLEAIGQLAAGIAHEINTPTQYVGDNTSFLKQSWSSLAPVLGLVRQICTEAQDLSGVLPQTLEELAKYSEEADLEYLLEEIPRAVDQSLEGVQRIAKIVRAMKEFSHPGSRERSLADINHAIENTITVARNEWKYVADVQTDLDKNLPLVSCFANEFNQAMLNLIVNASQAIAESHGRQAEGKGKQIQNKGKIEIATKRDGDWIEIRIQDNGSGIPEAIRNRIFEPFFTTKAVGKGTGQGLALAHSIVVKKHGGQIWFESEMGKGTTFFLRLPVNPVAEQSPAEAVMAHKAETGAVPNRGSSPQEGR